MHKSSFKTSANGRHICITIHNIFFPETPFLSCATFKKDNYYNILKRNICFLF